MTLFYPPLKPYPCGCSFYLLCQEHQRMLSDQRAALLRQLKR